MKGKTPELGDAPIEPHHHRMMNTIATVLDDAFNQDRKGEERTVGFILMVFPFGDPDERRCNYISNARREDVVSLLKDQIKRFEAQAAEKDNPTK